MIKRPLLLRVSGGPNPRDMTITDAATGDVLTNIFGVAFRVDDDGAARVTVELFEGLDLDVVGIPTYVSTPLEPVEDRRTPEEWLRDPHFAGIKIIDPDGWDRKDFEASWREPITREEMGRRTAVSTVTIAPKTRR